MNIVAAIVRTYSPSCFVAILLVALPAPSLAAGGTSKIASLGSPTAGNPSWPDGVESFVNLPGRTTGWCSWFTECPNDVNRYWFRTESMAELNSLLAKFAAIKSDRLQVILSPESGPADGSEFHGESAELSIGDQDALNNWFEQLDVDADGQRQFGAHRFEKSPTAQPLTLTIFLKHKSMRADELRLPAGLSVKRLAPRRAIGGEIITIF